METELGETTSHSSSNFAQFEETFFKIKEWETGTIIKHICFLKKWETKILNRKQERYQMYSKLLHIEATRNKLLKNLKYITKI